MSGDPSHLVHRSVKPCSSLEEERTCIDELDDCIIELLAMRGAYVADAARFKKGVSEGPAPNRVREVLERVKRQAGRAGLDPHVTEATYRAMIQAFIEWEAPQITQGVTSVLGPRRA